MTAIAMMVALARNTIPVPWVMTALTAGRTARRLPRLLHHLWCRWRHRMRPATCAPMCATTRPTASVMMAAQATSTTPAPLAAWAQTARTAGRAARCQLCRRSPPPYRHSRQRHLRRSSPPAPSDCWSSWCAVTRVVP
eukprot:6251343-Prymnesium_polylepis.1